MFNSTLRVRNYARIAPKTLQKLPLSPGQNCPPSTDFGQKPFKPRVIKLTCPSCAEIRRNGHYAYYTNISASSTERLARLADNLAVFDGWHIVPLARGWMAIERLCEVAK